MNNINPRSVLGEAFGKLTRIEVIDYIISKNAGWVLDKKKKEKRFRR